MEGFVSKAGRPAEVVLGAVFLLGALLKAGVLLESSDIDLFAVQIGGYGVITNKALLGPVALVVLGVELLLGLCLLLGLRFGVLTILAAQGVLVVFTGLIFYGWIFHGLADCGCLGAIKMPPAVSIAKNAVLLGLGALAWAGIAKRARPAGRPRGLVWRLAAVPLFSGLVLWHAAGDLQRVAPPAEGAAPFAKYLVEAPEGVYNLGEGEYLVAMLSMTCDHCMAEVPALNELLALPGLPPLVALCLEEQAGNLEEFRAMTGPQFPMYSLGNEMLEFFNLIESAPPHLAYVRQGAQVLFWVEHVPPYEELIEAINKIRGAA